MPRLLPGTRAYPPALGGLLAAWGSLYDLGDRTQAERDLRQAVALAPRTEARPLKALGLLLLALGRGAEGGATVRQAIQRAPDDGKLHWELGRYLMHVGDWPEAAEELTSARALIATSNRLTLELAWSLYRAGDLGAAEGRYLEAAMADPSSVEPWLGRGNVALAQGDPRLAGSCFRTACEMAPGDARAYAGLGCALARLSRHRDAAAALRKALALDPDYGLAHANMAATLYSLGRYREAWTEVRLAGRDASPDLVAALRARMPEP